MNNQTKQQIKLLFEQKRQNLGLTQGQAAVKAGTKSTTISQVFSGNYAADDTAIYQLLARWVGYDENQWVIAPTTNLRFITQILSSAAAHGHAYAIVGPAGIGKSAAQEHYAQNQRNAIHLKCDEFWTKQTFLQNLLRQLGREHGWQSMPEMMDTITATILKMDHPIIMIDEADKLRNDVLYLFISLYNRLEDHCGLVITATDFLTKRLERGIKFNWKGYQEIWSRIGRKPIETVKTRAKDVQVICTANGVDDPNTIAKITHECEGDLRRVKRAIHIAKLSLETV